MPDGSQTWSRVRDGLRAEIGEAAFRTWLDPVTFDEINGESVVLRAPSQFLRDWVKGHYVDRMRAMWCHYHPDVTQIDIVVEGAPGTAPAKPKTPAANATPPQMPAIPSERIETVAPVTRVPTIDQNASPFPRNDTGFNGLQMLDPSYTFESFVVGRPNEFAHAACQRVAESPSVNFNPLFLHGGVGLGKTHLMHAIGWQIMRLHPEKKVVYLTAEMFINEFIKALRAKNTQEFKELYRSVDVLMVDDLQFIIGKESTQEEFFHTFNALIDRGRQIIISADKSPNELSGIEERIRSRLGWGLVADIHPTTYELRLGILQQRAETAYSKQGHKVPQHVLEFIASRVSSSVRELEGAFNRIMAHTWLDNSHSGEALTIDTVRELLKDQLKNTHKQISVDDIQRVVAEHFNIRVSDMHSARRPRTIVVPRQIAMYLCKHLTTHSLPEIGKKFGGRDHTTVLHGIRKIDEALADDGLLAENIEAIRNRLEN